jgi:hypothetical protein
MTTGKPASNTVVQKSFASSFINGLVPATIDVSNECRNGVASVKRNFSFVNMLVSAITLGIFLPQNITVTCAAGGGMSDAGSANDADVTISSDATQAEVKKALSTAPIRSDGTLHIHVAR